MSHSEHTDIAIIGAGPSGAVAAALLRQHGYSVTVIEQQIFPRFSIGESLLPQCMHFLEEAGLLQLIHDNAAACGFQYKDGARFLWGERTAFYDFTDKFSAGFGTTYQVRRDKFDELLARGAMDAGADIRFGQRVLAVDVSSDTPVLTITDDKGQDYTLQARYLLDASGFGRVLPRLLDMERPSDFPVRQAAFTHITDNINHPAFERDKILITVHAADRRLWYWLIPFSDGRASFGVVGEPSILAEYGDEPMQILQGALAHDAALSDVLKDAVFDTPARTLVGYSADVVSLYGNNFALLGNAGEFLDPVFSSGVTIALKSASLAVPLVHRQLQGEDVDWQSEYEQALRSGIQVFRAYVEAWYQGDFQDVVFSTRQNDNVRRMISSLLAGYAWDATNPMNQNPARRLNALAQYCRDQ